MSFSEENTFINRYANVVIRCQILDSSHLPISSGCALPIRLLMKSVLVCKCTCLSGIHRLIPEYKAATYPFSFVGSASVVRREEASSTLVRHSLQNLRNKVYGSVQFVVIFNLIMCKHLCFRKYVSKVASRVSFSTRATSCRQAVLIHSQTSLHALGGGLIRCTSKE